MKKLYACVLLTLSAINNANAGDGHGKVQEINVHNNSSGHGVVMFKLEHNSNKASCSNQNEWAITLEKSFGQSVLSTLLVAQSQGKDVRVRGEGHCNSWGDREQPLYVVIKE